MITSIFFIFYSILSHLTLFFLYGVNPFLKCQSLNSSKLKEFADDNFKYDENCRKFSKRVENTVRKRRNCLLQAISRFPTLFSKDTQKQGLVWEWVKHQFENVFSSCQCTSICAFLKFLFNQYFAQHLVSLFVCSFIHLLTFIHSLKDKRPT